MLWGFLIIFFKCVWLFGVKFILLIGIVLLDVRICIIIFLLVIVGMVVIWILISWLFILNVSLLFWGMCFLVMFKFDIIFMCVIIVLWCELGIWFMLWYILFMCICIWVGVFFFGFIWIFDVLSFFVLCRIWFIKCIIVGVLFDSLLIWLLLFLVDVLILLRILFILLGLLLLLFFFKYWRIKFGRLIVIL